MSNLIFIYDDRVITSLPVSNIVGERRWGSILHKRLLLSDYVKSCLDQFDVGVDFRHVTSDDDLKMAIEHSAANNVPIYYHPASVVPSAESFALMLNKGMIARCNFLVGTKKMLGAYFLNADALEKILMSDQLEVDQNILRLEHEGLCLDIESYQDCLAFFSGGFESRYFNQIAVERNLIVKASTNKEKIRSEYQYYQLLPSSVQWWHVQPFNFQEDGELSSYTMERLQLPDMALQWLHGSLSEDEFEVFLDKVFYYLDTRPQQNLDRGSSSRLTDKLYLNKLESRYELFEKSLSFDRIDSLVKHCLNGIGLRSLLNNYTELYDAYCSDMKDSTVVIGHGDLCFSNMLYDKSTTMLRLIDPRGALSPEELWTDPYYDLAKLSHSVLGDYDWINNDVFKIEFQDNNKLALNIQYGDMSLTSYKRAFVKKLQASGYDITRVRLLEASLFLSMLPLHLDNERKVLAQILRAASIIDELKFNA